MGILRHGLTYQEASANANRLAAEAYRTAAARGQSEKECRQASF